MPAPCCCGIAAHRPTPAASTTTPIFPASFGPGDTWPDLSVTRQTFPASSKTSRNCRPRSPGRQSAETAGDGWITLVGAWIDRGVGDLAPLWSDDVLKAAIEAAHAQGARVTAPVFSQ